MFCMSSQGVYFLLLPTGKSHVVPGIWKQSDELGRRWQVQEGLPEFSSSLSASGSPCSQIYRESLCSGSSCSHQESRVSLNFLLIFLSKLESEFPGWTEGKLTIYILFVSPSASEIKPQINEGEKDCKKLFKAVSSSRAQPSWCPAKTRHSLSPPLWLLLCVMFKAAKKLEVRLCHQKGIILD